MAVTLPPLVRTFLEQQRVGHLATVSRGGEPHVVPVCYAVADDTIYTPIDEKPKQPGRTLRRVRNIEETGRAALVVDRYDEDWTQLGWVLLRGRAELLAPGSPEQARAVELLRQRYPQYRTMRLETQSMIALRIERVSVWGKLE
ncbi:TIGR03668 family PPOX class F420-dependent oxidoreductase [Thermomicrobium sp.]|jgi:PPOX class probable F420-dependent enzyme|uniref:TIGR03668 family PPOX class F420-dependent oxidoreductase n=1 Tax=Thermomicrobium sp. TaxID=1969469 RepID=UPI001B1951BA|nr:TIGR03668 family PPOX class F420-dependent oxidoreductase [Thermomicrobium sp.]MBO9307561.1 TIGR03668 family PPOX class F420-dependent oxidoreductase [Thermomicrobium sp.]MBO9351980.1 TIGR03668 family PPOX class F420-dependent oxidoreductase [Thermomicrobium sp.]MBO9358451.1 TIGR03668 family PPOX class F420-dependent oxidoreductase [Thermomicrobium sp.]